MRFEPHSLFLNITFKHASMRYLKTNKDKSLNYPENRHKIRINLKKENVTTKSARDVPLC